MSSVAAARDSRVVLRNVTWQTYEALLEARADDPAPRLTYDNGTLEISAPSCKHERLKGLIGRFIETFTLETAVRVRSAGSTTFRSQLKAKLEFRPFLTSLVTSGSSRSRRDDDCDPRSRSRRRSNEELDDPDVTPKGPALLSKGHPLHKGTSLFEAMRLYA